jgi:hypothetical protein
MAGMVASAQRERSVLVDPLAGVNQHQATEAGGPVAVLDVLVAVDDQPCLRLHDGQDG